MRIEVKGDTLDEAINNAMIELSTTSDNIDYEIKQEGSTGFLGIGAKPYIIDLKQIEFQQKKVLQDMKKK